MKIELASSFKWVNSNLVSVNEVQIVICRFDGILDGHADRRHVQLLHDRDQRKELLKFIDVLLNSWKIRTSNLFFILLLKTLLCESPLIGGFEDDIFGGWNDSLSV